jgi:hypothetical protein
MTDSRIWFARNPWPRGHRVIRCDWSGRLDDLGLWFDLHLQSASYTEGDPPPPDDDDEDEDESDAGDWAARGVWSNYGRCTLSSTMWPGYHAGLLVGSADTPLDLDRLVRRGVRADSLPAGPAEVALLGERKRAVGLYLLGHDTAADHHLRLIPTGPRAHLDWTGRIALTYVGAKTFRHTFRAVVARPRFTGFAITPGLPLDVARDLLALFTTDPSRFTLRAGRFIPRW